MYQYKPNPEQVKALGSRMRNGTGASRLLSAQDAPTHYLDSLQRFKKDFASYDREQRQEEKLKRQIDLERKRLQQMQRENQRWQMVQNYQEKLKSRQQTNAHYQRMGIKRAANSSSLAYNPINLSYDNNPEGLKLKNADQESNLRRFIRVKNMEDRGNSKFNPINGQGRIGIKQVVPQDLTDRYLTKLSNHYQNMRLKAPSLDLKDQNRRYY